MSLQVPPDREEFREEDLMKLPELRPPPMMPRGNVGTPTLHFMRLIQDCKLPASIIGKLHLDFPKAKHKGKYGSVPFDYKTGESVISGANIMSRKLSRAKKSNAGDKLQPPNTVNSVRSKLLSGSITNSKNNKDVVDSARDNNCDVQTEAESTVSTNSDSIENTSEVLSGKGVITDKRTRGPEEVPCVNSNNRKTTGSSTENAIDLTLEQSSLILKRKETEEEPEYKKKRRLKKLAKQETKRLMSERIEERMFEFEKGGSDSNEDNDSCEEWERHEAMYDDVTNQGRNKDRLFEEEMEVVWEKGGSGLVFYTDAQYWQKEEGDFDEQTADDLDVDMSAYYEDGAGDKDIKDFLLIRQEQRRRRGLEPTDRFTAGIGKFERHTKGIGRKLLEKQGWKEGTGLGSSVEGIADALDNEGKHPRDRQGFGYRGEKLVMYRNGKSRGGKRRRGDDVLISTVYDDPAQTDPVEQLKRRNDPEFIKHRDRIN